MATVTSIRCPACAFEQDDASDTCIRCGVIFAKARTVAPPARSSIPVSVVPSITEDRSNSKTWKMVGIGLVVALVLFVFRQRVNGLARSLLLLEPD